jgi:hypothetical protein
MAAAIENLPRCEFDDVVGGEVVDIGTKPMPDVKIIQPKLAHHRTPPAGK